MVADPSWIIMKHLKVTRTRPRAHQLLAQASSRRALTCVRCPTNTHFSLHVPCQLTAFVTELPKHNCGCIKGPLYNISVFSRLFFSCSWFCQVPWSMGYRAPTATATAFWQVITGAFALFSVSCAISPISWFVLILYTSCVPQHKVSTQVYLKPQV